MNTCHRCFKWGNWFKLCAECWKHVLKKQKGLEYIW